MKRFVLCILSLCVFAVGCHRGESNISDDGVVRIETRCDSALYVCYANSAMGPDTFGVEKRYCIAWPENAPAELYDEILRLAFRDSIGDFDVTTEHFLDDLMLFDDDTLIQAALVHEIDKSAWYSFEYVNVDCLQTGNLIGFTVASENYVRFAAHGMYSAHYITFDTDKNRIVRLGDLVDTALLGPVIVRAVEDLVINGDVKVSLFEEFAEAESFPVPKDFFIDTGRTCITLVYQLYDIAPYAYGIQSVVLPIYWLSKHLELTPYAKELFGEGSYLDVAEK